MKKLFLFIFQTLIMFIINIGCVYADISLNFKELNLGIDSSIQLNVIGDNTTNITWNTSDSKIATVINGRVFGASIGTAYISVSNGTYTDICKVNIISNYIPVNSISLNENSGTISVNETKKINTTIKPLNSSNKSVSYFSSDSSIATVDSSGLITGKKVGTAYITISAESKTASYKITVINAIKLNSIIISPSNIELTEGGTAKLSVIFNPVNASNKEVTWKSSNNSVVTVDSNGNLTGNSSGSATITAISTDNYYVASAKVTVNPIDKTLKGITFEKNELELDVGDTRELLVIFNPSSAENKKVTWSSSNSDIVSVEEGRITAIKPGKAQIKVVSDEGNFEAICKIIVLSDPIESISFVKESQTIYVGNSITLETVSIPEDTIINDPIWSSSDETVAVVSEDGVLTALQEGSSIITISDKEKKVTATTLINVEDKPAESLMITIDNYQLNFNPNVKKYTLKIVDENELRINVNRDIEDVIISGNRDLKDGSIITISIYGEETEKYIIEIKKNSISHTIFIVIIIVIILVNVYRLLKKSK